MSTLAARFVRGLKMKKQRRTRTRGIVKQVRRLTGRVTGRRFALKPGEPVAGRRMAVARALKRKRKTTAGRVQLKRAL